MTDKERLLQLFNKMESERQQLVSRLKDHPSEQLSVKPSPESWSAVEVILHLQKAEEGALKYMRKKLEYGGHRKASVMAGFRQRFLNLAISLPFKYVAPRIVEVKTHDNLSFTDVIEKWDEVRSDLRNANEGLEESIISNELFKHPAAGKMNVIQGVKFMRQHMNRHIDQINRTIEKVS